MYRIDRLPIARGRLPMKRRGAVLLSILAASASFGCHRLSRQEDASIQRWLLCEECTAGERDSVVALGDRAVTTLGKALQGPTQDRLQNIRTQVEAAYARISSHVVTPQAYVAHYLDNYVATYQSRAAVALARIGTPRAQAVLRDALSHDSVYRSDVRRTLGTAVAASLTIAAGDSQTAPFGALLLSPLAVALHDTTGQALTGVRVRFLVDSGGGQVVDSVQRTDANGGAAARWQLGPVDSLNLLRVVAAGRVVRFLAIGRPAGTYLAFTTQPTTASAGIPMSTVVVTAQDAYGRTIPAFSGNVTMTIEPGSGAPGAILSGGTVVAASAGVATFTNLSIDRAGTGYYLIATAGGTAGGRSAALTVN
jgi:PBS lyase HEAT-like repeat